MYFLNFREEWRGRRREKKRVKETVVDKRGRKRKNMIGRERRKRRRRGNNGRERGDRERMGKRGFKVKEDCRDCVEVI